MNLTGTYLHLHQGRAEAMKVDQDFWPRVMSGALPLPGWLVAMFEFPSAGQPSEPGPSERHPSGDEVHLCVSGAMSAVLEHPSGDEVIDFSAGECCVIPRGTWHRLVAREPSRIVAVTFGEGTEHRS
ncbi:MAG: cupin domain-containing protein [Pseudonocardiaceae bacterium]|nr:cupin domain-containing protein [Pseudonocardiaceae bacterium]